MTKNNSHAELVSASILERWNYLGLLFHLPLIKQYLIVLFGRVQSLILFALQILFAMLRATSSFGLRPHSTQNPQVRNDSILDYFVVSLSWIIRDFAKAWFLIINFHLSHSFVPLLPLLRMTKMTSYWGFSRNIFFIIIFLKLFYFTTSLILTNLFIYSFVKIRLIVPYSFKFPILKSLLFGQTIVKLLSL